MITISQSVGYPSINQSYLEQNKKTHSKCIKLKQSVFKFELKKIKVLRAERFVRLECQANLISLYNLKTLVLVNPFLQLERRVGHWTELLLLLLRWNQLKLYIIVYLQHKFKPKFTS